MASRWSGVAVLLVALATAGPLHAQTESSENTRALQRGLETLLSQAAPIDPPPEQSGVDRSRPAGEGAFTLTPGDRLEFHARGLDVADAFAQLRQLVRRNIVVSPDVSARFTGDLYDLTVEQIVDAICRSTHVVAKYEGTFIFIEPDKPETRIFHLDHARAEDLIDVIQPLLSPTGLVTATIASEQGIESTQEEAGGDDYAHSDTLIVRDFTTNLEVVVELIKHVDAQPQQVLVEATIMTAQMNDDFQLGVEFTLLFGQDFADGGFTSPDGLSLIPGSFDGGQLDDGLGNATTAFLDLLKPGGLNVGYLNNGKAAFVKALSSLTDVKVLANPKIITLNKQRGEVLLGRRDGYRTTTVTQTSTIERIEFLETGTRLIFRPFITSNGYVRMEVHPEDSDGGVDDEGLPFKDTAEVTTNVMIRDGETVVIGGLFRERTAEGVRKVPILGDLPLVGGLFRVETREKIREEIIILLTPHILKPAAEDDTASAGAGDRETAAASASVDLEQLARVYVETARGLLAQGRFMSASVLLDGLTPVDRQQPDVVKLRRQAWRGRLRAPEHDDVDTWLTDQILQDME